jgi:gliding motility-associated-like protein
LLKKWLHIIPLMFLFLNTDAQTNLINNGSFESFSLCPFQLSSISQQVPQANGWTVPTTGTPDYFSTCADQATQVKVPLNSYGFQSAKDGNSYVGILAYSKPTTPTENIREYIQTELSQPLTAGKIYYFKMYVSLANSALFRKTVSNIGAYFSASPVSSSNNNALIFTPQIVSNTFIKDKAGWVEVSGGYTASGGEKHITIGRFEAENTARIADLAGDNNTNNAYYYIDDISLIDSCYQFSPLSVILGSNTQYNCVLKPVNVKLDATNAITSNYLWNTGQTTPDIIATDTGKHWVKMSSGKCYAFDTVQIAGKTKPQFTLGNDTAACFSNTLHLKPTIFVEPSLAYTYRWIKRVGTTIFELGNTQVFNANYPDEFILELSVNGCKNYDTITLHPTVLGKINLGNDTSICRNTQRVLDATSANTTKYLWSTGEISSKISSKSNKPFYWVKATDNFCVSIDTIKYTLKGPKKLFSDTTVCGQQLLTLSADISAGNYMWSTSEQTQQITVDHGGTYWLTQQDTSCITSDSVTIVMDSIPYANLGPDTIVCVDPLFELKANAPNATTYLWNTGDTTSSILFQKAGKFVVTTINKNCLFRDSVLLQTQINQPFAFGPDKSDCFQEPIILNPKTKRNDILLWNNGSSATSMAVTTPGIYWLKVISGVCVNYDTIVFAPKNVPHVNLGNDTTLCNGATVQLDAQDSADRYFWNNGLDSRIIHVDKTGYYFVTKTNDEGCYAVDSIVVTFINGFELFPKHELYLCADSSVTILPTQNLNSYIWNDQSTLPELNATHSGLYWLEATDSTGCKVSDTVRVTQVTRPDLGLESFIKTCELPVHIQPQGTFAHYFWSDGSNSPDAFIKAYGPVTLRVSDSSGCQTSASLTIENICPAGVTITNVFTPNNDGLNDIIIPQYQHIVSTQFVIQNRWGNKIFETQDVTLGWDGDLKSGIQAEEGVYFFTLTCKDSSNNEYTKNGTITLLR